MDDEANVIRARSIGFALAAFTSIAGCGTEEPPVSCRWSNLLPLAVGNEWTYEVTTSTAIEIKTNRVVGTDVLAGVPVFIVETQGAAGSRTVSYQAREESAMVRYRDESYAGTFYLGRDDYLPWKVRVPPSIDFVGRSLMESHQEQHFDATGAAVSAIDKVEQWTLAGCHLTMVTPAGTFTDVVELRRVSLTGGSDKRFWFAERVGKIREEGGQTEVLTAYTVM